MLWTLPIRTPRDQRVPTLPVCRGIGWYSCNGITLRHKWDTPTIYLARETPSGYLGSPIVVACFKILPLMALIKSLAALSATLNSAPWARGNSYE